MKKISLIVTWTFIMLLFLTPFAYYSKLSKNINMQISTEINDDGIYLTTTNDEGKYYDYSRGNRADVFGITLKQQEEIKNIEGVKDVEFTSPSSPEYFYASEIVENLKKDGTIEAEAYQINGNFDTNIYNGYETLKYVSGREIQADDEIVISQEYEEVLKDKQASNLNGNKKVIGSKVRLGGENYKIVGVYQNTAETKKRTNYNNTVSDLLYEEEEGGNKNKEIVKGYTIDNGFYTKKNNNTVYSDDVYDWNQIVGSEAYEQGQYYSADNKVRENLNKYIEENGENGEYDITYDQAVTAGVKDLVNPETVEKIYGNQRMSEVYVQTKTPEERDRVEKILSEKYPYVSIMDSDTNFEDFHSYKFTKLYIKILIGYTLVVFLFMYKAFKGLKKSALLKKFVFSYLIASLVSLIIVNIYFGMLYFNLIMLILGFVLSLPLLIYGYFTLEKKEIDKKEIE